MTISEFFHSKQLMAVACPTEDQAKKLLQRFMAHGHRYWSNGSRYDTGGNCWCHYKEDTCYSNRHSFCYRRYYETHGFTIIPYETLVDDVPALDFLFSFENK